MDSHRMVLLLFLCYIFISTNEVEGGQWNLSKEEDMELERQLKSLNKPAVKTILTEYGDIYDCVDFYKQPAFDHPLLKDYKVDFKIKPILTPIKRRDQNSHKKGNYANLKLKGGGCPIGTVPIKRTTKEDLIRERQSSTRILAGDDKPGAHYAVARTKPGSKKYVGAGGEISIHNPHCSGMQYSAARIKVQNGPDSIEAGWRVDPTLYGDTRTRLSIRLDAGHSHCFNTRCPGFIIVDTDIPLGDAYERMTKPQGPSYYVTIYLNRDLINGNWYLQVGKNNTVIGYWPSRIFTGLSDLATSAEWGGEVYSPPGTMKPPMGAGQFLVLRVPDDAYICNIAILDGKSTLSPNCETFADSRYYRVKDEGNVGSSFGHLILYGGPPSY